MQFLLVFFLIIEKKGLILLSGSEGPPPSPLSGPSTKLFFFFLYVSFIKGSHQKNTFISIKMLFRSYKTNVSDVLKLKNVYTFSSFSSFFTIRGGRIRSCISSVFRFFFFFSFMASINSGVAGQKIDWERISLFFSCTF